LFNRLLKLIDIRFKTSRNISRTGPDRSDYNLETGPNRNYYSLNQDRTKIIKKNIDSNRTDPSPIFIRWNRTRPNRAEHYCTQTCRDSQTVVERKRKRNNKNEMKNEKKPLPPSPCNLFLPTISVAILSQFRVLRQCKWVWCFYGGLSTIRVGACVRVCNILRSTPLAHVYTARDP
jgi:hypothetical protein